MACRHPNVTTKIASLVRRSGQRDRLRTFCADCGQYVETEPRVNKRTGDVLAGEWVPVDFVISEPEFDPKV